MPCKHTGTALQHAQFNPCLWRLASPPFTPRSNVAFDPQQLVAAQQAAALQVAQQQAAAAQQQAAAQQLQQLHPALASASLAPAPGVSGGLQVGVPAQTLATGIGVGGLGQHPHVPQQPQPHSTAVGLGPCLTPQQLQHPAAQQSQQPGQSQQHPGGVPVGSGLSLQPPVAAQVAPQQGDVDMGGTEAAVVPPIVIHNPKEPVREAAREQRGGGEVGQWGGWQWPAGRAGGCSLLLRKGDVDGTLCGAGAGAPGAHAGPRAVVWRRGELRVVAPALSSPP